MSSLAYESPAERTQSIARMGELRDRVDAYRASCTTRYRELNPPDSAAWWDGISAKRKRQLAKEIAREEKAAVEWMKTAPKLPSEEDGRDSANIQPYGFFADRIVRVDPEDRDDQDTDDYTRMFDAREDELNCDLESAEADDEVSDSLLVGVSDAYEPEISFDWESIESEEEFAGVLEATAQNFNFAEHLNVAICQYNEEHLRHDIADVMSGDLASSWRRVKQHAALGWEKKDGKFVRIQTRGDKEDAPESYYHRTTKKVHDTVSGKVIEMKVLRLSNEAIESVRRRWANNSKINFIIFDMVQEQLGNIELVNVHYPEGETRQFSRDTCYALAKFSKREWRQASAYCKTHVAGYHRWLWDMEYSVGGEHTPVPRVLPWRKPVKSTP